MKKQKRFFLFVQDGQKKVLTPKGEIKQATRTILSRLVKLKNKVITFVPEWYLKRPEHLHPFTPIELYKHLNTVCQ